MKKCVRSIFLISIICFASSVICLAASVQQNYARAEQSILDSFHNLALPVLDVKIINVKIPENFDKILFDKSKKEISKGSKFFTAVSYYNSQKIYINTDGMDENDRVAVETHELGHFSNPFKFDSNFLAVGENGTDYVYGRLCRYHSLDLKVGFMARYYEFCRALEEAKANLFAILALEEYRIQSPKLGKTNNAKRDRTM